MRVSITSPVGRTPPSAAFEFGFDFGKPDYCLVKQGRLGFET
jgi:hypothetical protein